MEIHTFEAAKSECKLQYTFNFIVRVLQSSGRFNSDLYQRIDALKDFVHDTIEWKYTLDRADVIQKKSFSIRSIALLLVPIVVFHIF